MKLELNLLLSIFSRSRPRILNFATGIFERKFGKKMNIERWSENFDETLPDLVSSKEVEFEKILSVNIDGLTSL